MVSGEWPTPTAEFHLTGLAPRRYLVAARVRGYAPTFAGPFDLGAEDMRSGIDLELNRGASVTGTVSDTAGQPIAKSFLYFAPDSDWGRRRLLELDHLLLDEGERSMHGCERVDDKGNFNVEHLPTNQPYLLCALSRDHKPTIVGRIELHEVGEVLKRDVVMAVR